MDNLHIEGVFPDGQHLSFPITHPRMVVGTSVQADIRIPSSQLAPEHFAVEHHGDQVFVTGLNSSQDISVNGQQLSPLNPFPLSPDAVIMAAGIAFRILPGQAVAEHSEQASPAANSSIFHLSSDRRVLRPGQRATLTLLQSGNERQQVFFRSHSRIRGIRIDLEPEARLLEPGERASVQITARRRGLLWMGGQFRVALVALSSNGHRAVEEVTVRARPRYELLLIALLLLLPTSVAVAAVGANLFFPPADIEITPPTAVPPSPTREFPTLVPDSQVMPALTPATPSPTSEPPTFLPTTPVLAQCVVQCGHLGWVDHVIRSGDTLTNLAASTGGSVTQIQQVNCLANPDVIAVGQTICLPAQIQLPQLPVADFSFAIEEIGCDEATVRFINQSVAASSSGWDFGDDSSDTEPNPVHTYGLNASAHDFPVTLTVFEGALSDSATQTITIVRPEECNLPEGPTAEFDYVLEGREGCNVDVQFLDRSVNADSYAWDFGDGDSSSDQNPTHVYVTPGDLSQTYDVTLSVTGSGGADSITTAVTLEFDPNCGDHEPTPVAAFSYELMDTDNCAVLVDFVNESVGAVTYLWNFGQGNESNSTEENPQNVYDTTGERTVVYTVTLTVTGPGGSDSTSMDLVLMFEPPCIAEEGPVAQFDYEPLNGRDCTEPVDFRDRSTGATTYSWSFGDGETSTEQNPYHTYVFEGNLISSYTVILTVTAPGGTDTVTMDVVVRFGDICNEENPIVNFATEFLGGEGCTEFVLFENQSLGAINYFWEFGDGTTSTESNPTHAYNFSGSLTQTYTVSLTAINLQENVATADADVTVNFNPACFDDVGQVELTAAFSVALLGNEGCSADVEFINLSEGAISYRWEFGDGATSIEQNPIHGYAFAGNLTQTYTVMLRVLDELENVATASADVTLNFDPACLDFDDVGSAEPVAAFTFNPIGAEGCSATVQFIDQSERATSYSWDFGDGTTSQEQNPIHDYTSPFIPSLTYRVLLRVDGPGGSNEIEQSLVVDFGPTCRTVLIEDPGVILGDDIGLIPVQEEPPALIEEFPPTTEEPPVLEFQPTDAQAPPLVEAEIPITVEQQPTANASAVPEEAIDPVIQQTSDAKEPPVLSTPRPSTDEAPTDIAAPLAPEVPDTTTPQ